MVFMGTNIWQKHGSQQNLQISLHKYNILDQKSSPSTPLLTHSAYRVHLRSFLYKQHHNIFIKN